MTVRVYKSTDASAPQFSTAAVGRLIPILDACLVTGYGSQTPAGWTKEYTGTNKAVYRQGTGSNGFYLWVNDTVNANYVYVRGYESMTGLDTGTNPFPTVAQAAPGRFWLKNSSADPAWMVVATERAFYFWTQYSTVSSYGQLGFFGDISTYVSGDAYHTVLVGAPVFSTTSSPDSMNSVSSSILTALSHVYIARDYTQTSLSPGCSRIVNPIYSGGDPTQSFNHQYDNLTGNITLYNMFIGDLSGMLRGKLPGILGLPKSVPYGAETSRLSDITGSGTETGKTFALLSCGTDYYLIETSDTW